MENPTFRILDISEKEMLLGEAYTLRAFIQFDLLRLFGHQFIKNPTVLAIPYVRTPYIEAQPILAANVVIDNIVADLNVAVKYLEKDPIRTKGPNRINTSSEFESLDFYSNRHRRLNYYAAKTLQARVLLYAGKKDAAFTVSKSILEEQESFFPW